MSLSDALRAAMEPSLVGREEPDELAEDGQHLLTAAMEPSLVGREEARINRHRVVLTVAAMEPSLVGREEPT